MRIVTTDTEVIRWAAVIEVTGILCVEERVRGWCKLPYPGHPKGCPNYGRKTTCPPQVGMVDGIYDLSKPHYLVVIEFDLAKHVDKMLSKHPDWTDKQCRCVLYWQGTARKELRNLTQGFIQFLGEELIHTDCPEAMGVNLFKTCYKAGIRLKRNPRGIVRKIALVGEAL